MQEEKNTHFASNKAGQTVDQREGNCLLKIIEFKQSAAYKSRSTDNAYITMDKPFVFRL